MRKTSKEENQEMERLVRRDINRFVIESGDVRIMASNGVVHLQGRIRPMRGRESIFEGEIETFLTALRQRPAIREVIVDWSVLR